MCIRDVNVDNNNIDLITLQSESNRTTSQSDIHLTHAVVQRPGNHTSRSSRKLTIHSLPHSHCCSPHSLILSSIFSYCMHPRSPLQLIIKKLIQPSSRTRIFLAGPLWTFSDRLEPRSNTNLLMKFNCCVHRWKYSIANVEKPLRNAFHNNIQRAES